MKPTQLSPPARQYVVWIMPSGNGKPREAGVLVVAEDQTGELKTATTESKFTLLVTAQNEARPKSPSNRVVLEADVEE